MAFFEWSESLDLGVEDMNDEHKVLIDLMNKLYDQNKGGSSKPEIQSTITELFNWTKTHFEHEEKYMESVEFPGVATHKVIHKTLLDQLTEHANQFSDSLDSTMDEKFFLFLKIWLTGHIQGIDMQYGKHVNAA